MAECLRPHIVFLIIFFVFIIPPYLRKYKCKFSHISQISAKDKIGDYMKKTFLYITGFVAGILNGLFGSGGGVAAVPLLQKSGLATKPSHATSIAVTFVLSLVSAIFYFFRGSIDLSEALPLVPFGIAGAVLGCFLMKKIPTRMLRGIFGGILVISAARLFFS